MESFSSPMLCWDLNPSIQAPKTCDQNSYYMNSASLRGHMSLSGGYGDRLGFRFLVLLVRVQPDEKRGVRPGRNNLRSLKQRV